MIKILRERHAPAVRALAEAAKRVVPPDQRVILLVYDGPEAVVREVSIHAPDQLPVDVRLILEAVAKQVDPQ